MPPAPKPCGVKRGLALAAAAALTVSFLVAPEALPGLDSCFFRKTTGIACPGCGLSHSFCAISHGRFPDAWAYNPFGIVFYSLAVALVLRPVAARFLRRRRGPVPCRRSRPEWLVRGTLPLTILLLAAMYAFAIARSFPP
jgi:hypothetical protein